MNEIYKLERFIGYLAFFAYNKSEAHMFVGSKHDKMILQPPSWYWLFKDRVFL